MKKNYIIYSFITQEVAEPRLRRCPEHERYHDDLGLFVFEQMVKAVGHERGHEHPRPHPTLDDESDGLFRGQKGEGRFLLNVLPVELLRSFRKVIRVLDLIYRVVDLRQVFLEEPTKLYTTDVRKGMVHMDQSSSLKGFPANTNYIDTPPPPPKPQTPPRVRKPLSPLPT